LAEIQKINYKNHYEKRKNTLTIAGIKSTIDVNFGKLHNDLRNNILEALLEEFPAGNSSTLPSRRTLP
jgi:hypothetical protein